MTSLRHHVGCCDRVFGPGGQRLWKQHELDVPRIHRGHQQHRFRIHCLRRTGVLHSQRDVNFCDHSGQLHSHHHPHAHARSLHHHQDHRNFYCSGSHIYDLHFRVYIKQHSVSSIRDLLGEFLRLYQHVRVALMICPRVKNMHDSTHENLLTSEQKRRTHQHRVHWIIQSVIYPEDMHSSRKHRDCLPRGHHDCHSH